jgi:uncharacterized damage-inducible protein DinB
MFLTIDQFSSVWKGETAATLRLFDALTDESLTKPDRPDVRNLGRAAWHIVTTYPEMGGLMGITFDSVTAKDAIPASADQIRQAYRNVSETVLKTVSNWTDADLLKKDEMYGETWERGKSLWAFLAHEIHHRGQMTIMMRLAGLKVPGLYGPSQEEWKQHGMEPPRV